MNGISILDVHSVYQLRIYENRKRYWDEGAAAVMYARHFYAALLNCYRGLVLQSNARLRGQVLLLDILVQGFVRHIP